MVDESGGEEDPDYSSRTSSLQGPLLGRRQGPVPGRTQVKEEAESRHLVKRKNWL